MAPPYIEAVGVRGVFAFEAEEIEQQRVVSAAARRAKARNPAVGPRAGAQCRGFGWRGGSIGTSVMARGVGRVQTLHFGAWHCAIAIAPK